MKTMSSSTRRSGPARRVSTPALRLLGGVLVAGALAGGLSACAPLLIGGAVVGGTLVALDRRTTGTQVEDQAIELKAAQRVRDVAGERAHVNVTSYNRLVLLTGEAETAELRGAIEQAVARVENVRSIVNEIGVLGATSLTARSTDSITTGRVKAALVDAKDLQANAFKVVTERGVTHLMGRVTEREANRATEVARGVNGVQKVVRVFELLSEAELADLEKAAKK
jgi:osmotically-inducible protein OsmY